VPSLKILDTIGFDMAIDRAAALLDIKDPAQIRRNFPRVYPLGLGIISTSPLRMARAFAVFGNQGRSVTPIAIRSVEDRNGRVKLDLERDLRQQQRRMGTSIQVVSPQNAYIMTQILEKTVEEGTLYAGSGWGSKFTFRDANGKSYRMPVAGKTGTTQNWSDAWAIGYSPYYTTAIWFGFDKPGNSLGVDLTGSTLTGHVWGDYMREIHKGLSYRDFSKPTAGIIDVTVCAKSGLLKTPSCNDGEVTLPFLEGTQPLQYCDIHGGGSPYPSRTPTVGLQLGVFDDESLLNSLPMPILRLDLLPELREAPRPPANQNNRGTSAPADRDTPGQSQSNQPPLPEAVPVVETTTRPEPEQAEDSGEEAGTGDDDDLPSWNPLE
jgi:penicillin-binding protein 1A